VLLAIGQWIECKLSRWQYEAPFVLERRCESPLGISSHVINLTEERSRKVQWSPRQVKERKSRHRPPLEREIARAIPSRHDSTP
jgi:hypothetical protein